MRDRTQDLYALKRDGYQLESINFKIDLDDGTCSICYSDYEILHVNDLRENPTLSFDICTICLNKMYQLVQDSRL